MNVEGIGLLVMFRGDDAERACRVALEAVHDIAERALRGRCTIPKAMGVPGLPLRGLAEEDG